MHRVPRIFFEARIRTSRSARTSSRLSNSRSTPGVSRTPSWTS